MTVAEAFQNLLPDSFLHLGEDFALVGLLDVLHEYDCGGLGRKPCQDGPCGASLRQAMRNPG